jgi:hypothetical protein
MDDELLGSLATRNWARSRLGGHDQPNEVVVQRSAEFLLAAEIALSGLNR